MMNYERHREVISRSARNVISHDDYPTMEETAEITVTAANSWIREQQLRAILDSPAPDADEEDIKDLGLLLRTLDRHCEAPGRHSTGLGRADVQFPRMSAATLASLDGLGRHVHTDIINLLDAEEGLEVRHVAQVDVVGVALRSAGHHLFTHFTRDGFKFSARAQESVTVSPRIPCDGTGRARRTRQFQGFPRAI